MSLTGSDTYDFLEKVLNFLTAEASGYGGLGIFIVLTFVGYSVIKNKILKKETSSSTGLEGVDIFGEKTTDPKTKNTETDGAGTENQMATTLEKTPDEKQKEAEENKKKDSLEELFDLFTSDAKKERRIQQPEEMELEKLGIGKEMASDLRTKVDYLISEIVSLMDKGLKDSQIAKTLTSRSAAEIPLIELQPLIDAMNCFLNEECFHAEKEVSVIGVDPGFERKAVFSALLKGDYDDALIFLENGAERAESKAFSSQRKDIKQAAENEAVELYLAIAALARPVSTEKSFEALKKAYDYAPKNPMVSALIGRAYYENGQTKQAQSIFEKSLENTPVVENDVALSYMSEMVPKIRMERTALHAARIRKEYENLVGDDFEAHLRTPQEQTNQFILNEIRERGSEGRVAEV